MSTASSPSSLNSVMGDYSLDENTSSPSDGGNRCMICLDTATGNHYGALSCYGCKGFFQRTVRNEHTYICRFERNCDITKQKRNLCRYCRLRRCLKAGMKREEVQGERDKIGYTKRARISKRGSEHLDPDNPPNPITLATLVKASTVARQIMDSCVKPSIDQTPDSVIASSNSVVTMNDIQDSLKLQLVAMTEWATCVPGFRDLHLEDQVALFKNYASLHLNLELARRSLHLKDQVMLSNGLVFSRTDPENVDGLKRLVRGRLIDEIIKPLQKLSLDDTEFACFEALIFFDPNAKDLKAVGKVEDIRDHVQCLLEDYIMEHQQSKTRGRFGKLLLILPSLHSIAAQTIETVQCARLFGMVKFDGLLEEMLLGGTNGDLTSTEPHGGSGSIAQDSDGPALFPTLILISDEEHQHPQGGHHVNVNHSSIIHSHH